MYYRTKSHEPQVKIIQKWDGNKSMIFNIPGSFYSYLKANKIDEKGRIIKQLISLPKK